MAMNRVLGTLFLLLCLCASISTLTHNYRRLRTRRLRITRPTGCSDKLTGRNCRYYVANGYCTSTSYVWIAYMKSNCARSCGFCSAPTKEKTTTSPVATTIPAVTTTTPSITTTTLPVPPGCRDKYNVNSCRYYSSNGFCSRNNNNWFTWMKSNCAKTCGLCSVPTTGAPSQQQWFQIHSTAYDKCLALTYVSRRTAYRYFTKRVSIFMNDCTHPSGQLWRWTSRGQLQSSLNQQCLAVTRVWTGYLGWRTGLSMQPCNSVTSEQEWVCSRGFLKVKKLNLYLVPFIFVSGIRRIGSVRLGYRSQLTSNCLWTRYGTSKSICATEKATTTTSPVTTTNPPVTTTNPPVTTTNPPVTTTKPPVTTTNPPTTTTNPPVPPTDGIATPPPPPTGTLNPPPFPGNTPPPPPVVTTTKSPPPQGNKNIRCGTKGIVGGVVNGTAAAAGSWPWQVGIKKCAHCNITCGATLINDEWVVTAAHCVSGWFADELYLVLGEVDQSKKSGHEQRFKGNKIIIHEDYAFDAPYDKDIALVRLDKYAVFNDHVRPLCMPKKGTALTAKDLCTVTGFGRVAQNAAKSVHLLQANVNVVPLDTCEQSYMKLSNPRKVTSNMLCAGYKRGGTDACQGDSGGPLTCFDRSRFRFILGGVVSWGVGCARPDLYGVYSNTALLAPWVEKKLAAYGY